MDNRLVQWRRAVRAVGAQYRHWHGGRAPNLRRPVRYSEKIQWRKLFDLNPAYAVLSDKLAAREFVAGRIGRHLLVPVLWSGDDPDAIPFDRLPPGFALKSTHGSGDVAIVRPEAPVDRDDLRAQARTWLSRSFLVNHEPAYVHLPRRLVIEPLVTTASGEAPLERKLFVFGGRVRLVNTVVNQDGRVRNAAFHTPDGTRLDWWFSRPPLEVPWAAPEALAAMVRAAEAIGAGFDHLRVDFYDPGDRVLVGEITVYPWSGGAVFTPESADFAMGAFWPLPRPGLRALATMATRRWTIPFRPPSV